MKRKFVFSACGTELSNILLEFSGLFYMFIELNHILGVHSMLFESNCSHIFIYCLAIVCMYSLQSTHQNTRLHACTHAHIHIIRTTLLLVYASHLKTTKKQSPPNKSVTISMRVYFNFLFLFILQKSTSSKQTKIVE